MIWCIVAFIVACCLVLLFLSTKERIEANCRIDRKLDELERQLRGDE